MTDPRTTNIKTAYTASQEYAMRTIDTVNAYVLEVLLIAERLQYEIPAKFNIDTPEWNAGAAAIEQAVAMNNEELTRQRCDSWRERSKGYCVAWFEKIERDALKGRAKTDTQGVSNQPQGRKDMVLA